MKKVLLLTHGHMASGIKNTVSILLGNADHLDTIDAYVDEKNISDQLDAYFASLEENDQLIALCDLMGGSTYQQFVARYDRRNMFVIAGINLALVLELLIDKDKVFTQNELNDLVAQSRQMLMLVEKEESKEIDAEEDFF